MRKPDTLLFSARPGSGGIQPGMKWVPSPRRWGGGQLWVSGNGQWKYCGNSLIIPCRIPVPQVKACLRLNCVGMGVGGWATSWSGQAPPPRGELEVQSGWYRFETMLPLDQPPSAGFDIRGRTGFRCPIIMDWGGVQPPPPALVLKPAPPPPHLPLRMPVLGR